MANITAETNIIRSYPRGEDVRDAIVDALLKLAGESLPDVSNTDAGKILAVDGSGQWAARSVVPTLDRIAVTTMPSKTSYRVGETISFAGLVVTATKTADLVSDVTSEVTNLCTFDPSSGTAFGSEGTKTITVSYTEDGITRTTSFDITVTRAASGLTITSMPTKTSYSIGETLDLSGIAVAVTYSDGTTADVTSSCTFSPADGSTLSSAGIKTVTVSYAESGETKTTTFNVNVSASSGERSIAVTRMPNKTTYNVDTEALDLTGLVVTETQQDGTTADVTSSCTFDPPSGTTFSTGGTKAIAVTYDGMTTSFSISVTTSAQLASIRISKSPNKTQYSEGDSLDLSGCAITATYDDGSTDAFQWNHSGVTFDPAHGERLNTTGRITVQCSYTENGVTKTDSIYVQVNEYMKYLKIVSTPSKTVYNSGEAFSSSGLSVAFVSDTTVNVTSQVRLDYENGEILNIPDGMSSIDYYVEVSYTYGTTTYTASFKITVRA